MVFAAREEKVLEVCKLVMHPEASGIVLCSPDPKQVSFASPQENPTAAAPQAPDVLDTGSEKSKRFLTLVKDRGRYV